MSEDLYVATFLLIFLTFYLKEKILYLRYIDNISIDDKIEEIKNIGYPNTFILIQLWLNHLRSEN